MLTPTRLMFARISELFYTYVATLLADPGWDLLVVKAPFVPGPNLVFDDVTLDPDYDNDPIPVAAYGFGGDPIKTGTSAIFTTTVGSDVFQSDTDGVRTVYGFILAEHAGSFLYASELLPTPISVERDGDFIRKPFLTFNFPLNMFVTV